MIKVVYDYQIFWQQKYGGISRYFYDLATRIGQYDSLDVKILAGMYINGYLREIESELVVGTAVPSVPKTGLILKYFNYYFAKAWVQANSPQIVHETFYSTKGVAARGAATVLTVYDFMDEIFSPGNGISSVKVAAIRRADHIICISQSTRNDLLERIDVDPKKVSVVYPGVGFADSLLLKSLSDTNVCKANPGYPYVLFVGNRSGYKNFYRVVQAFASSKTLFKDFKIVCFGSVPLKPQEIQFSQALGLPEDTLVRVTGDDALLESYYRGASALVFPSLYEGFGNPPLEAMAACCPAICSNTSSMPEVSGDVAEYFNPYDIESIATALENVLYSKERSQDMIVRGKERAKLFSLDQFATGVRDIYLSLT